MSLFKIWISEKHNGNENLSFFDELLYKQRFAIERTNACLDPFQGNFSAF